MAETVFRVFDSPDEAIAAVNKLRGNGVPLSAITIISSEPIHIEAIESEKGTRSRIGLFAIAGASIGAATAVALTVWTSQSVNLVTGGMPIVSPWPFGIITFELTALGAILGTLARMIYEGRLIRRERDAPYDEAIADGKVGLVIDCAGDGRVQAVKKALGETFDR